MNEWMSIAFRRGGWGNF